MNIISGSEKNAIVILQYITNSILTDNLEELTDLLEGISFEQLTLDQASKLLINLLNICYRYNNPRLANLIFQENSRFYSIHSDLNFLTYLFLNNKTEVQVLSFLIRECKLVYNFLEIVHELIMITDEYETNDLILAFDKCWQAFSPAGIPTLETLKKLKEYADNRNDVIAFELTARIRQINDYAEVPKWLIIPEVLPTESSVIAPENKNLKIELPKNDELLKLLIERLDNSIQRNINCQDPELIKIMRDELLINFYSLPLRERSKILKEYFTKVSKLSLEDDRLLFITLGPSAPLIDSTIEELDYGGARMFTFNNFDRDEEIDDFDLYDTGVPRNITDWFVGYCQECNLKIRRRWHAVRIPIRYGGWKGCFCSWECVRGYITDVYNADEVMLGLVDLHEERIKEIGILDRIPDEEYDQYIADIINTHKSVIENNEVINIELRLPKVHPEIAENIDQIIKPKVIELPETNIVLHFFCSKRVNECSVFKDQLYKLLEYVPVEGNIRKNVSISEIDIEEINVEEVGIKEIPTVVVTKEGDPLHVFVGSNVDIIRNFLQEI